MQDTDMHIQISHNTTTNKKQKKLSPKIKKDLGMACHAPPLKKEETRGNAITQPQSHPIKKCRI